MKLASPPTSGRSLIQILPILLLLSGGELNGGALIRGPYLQSATPSSITIRWRTDAPAQSVVRYGVDEASLNRAVLSEFPTTEHEVTLAGLTPDTRYYYSVGDHHAPLAVGPEFTFSTHPRPGTRKRTRIWAIGDFGTHGTGAGKQVAVRDAFYDFTRDEPADVWLALGDNAYFFGTDAEYQASFFDIYPTLLRNTPFWSTIGNHETYAVPAGQTLPYQDMFTFPTLGEAGGIPSGTEKYYSFNYGNIHFVCLDSEISDRSAAGPMLTWLRADLEANTADWLIAFWHSPPYTKGSHDSDNLADSGGRMADMRANAVRLLEDYGVDLVLSGHSHIYERSFLLDGHYGMSNTLVPEMIKDAGSGRENETGAYRKPDSGPTGHQGAVYVVAGSGGWATFRTGVHPAMFMDRLEVGSVIIDVDGDRLDAKFLRETGAIDDHFTIIKGATPEDLRITSFTVRDGEAIVSWKSVAGGEYQIERTSRLDKPNWLPVSGRISASGATSKWKEPLDPQRPVGFYRVVALEPAPVPAGALAGDVK